MTATPSAPAEGYPSSEAEEALSEHLQDAEAKAWDALGRYKFVMFGYWCGVWVHLNRLQPQEHRDPNPWRGLVKLAKVASECGKAAGPGCAAHLSNTTVDAGLQAGREAAEADRW